MYSTQDKLLFTAFFVNWINMELLQLAAALCLWCMISCVQNELFCLTNYEWTLYKVSWDFLFVFFCNALNSSCNTVLATIQSWNTVLATIQKQNLEKLAIELNLAGSLDS